MSFNKQFDEETGYAASRDLPIEVAQYIKATGKSEEQVAKEIINEDPEWLDWRTHTQHPGNSTPEDNGWTDLKKLGLGIGDSWNNHRENTDPMWRVGLVNAIFGDPSMLGQYYQMQNQNEQNRLNRESQHEYNSQLKAIEDSKQEALRQAERNKLVNEARPVLAQLQKDYLEAGEQSKVIINKKINALLENYPELGENNIEEMAEAKLLDDNVKSAAEEAEVQRQLKVSKFMMSIPTNIKSNKERASWAKKNIDSNEDLNASEKKTAYDVLNRIKTLQQAVADAQNAAIASKAGKKTGDNIDEKDQKKKDADAGRAAIKAGRTPTRKQQKAIDEGY